MVYLREISCFDYDFLYDILLEREPYMNISHKNVPSFETHVKFWESSPYEYSAIIVHKDIKKEAKENVGYIYLTKRSEIGIFVRNVFRKRGYGREALKLLLNKFSSRNRKFLANIAPKNFVSKNFFKSAGFSELQDTYCYGGQL